MGKTINIFNELNGDLDAHFYETLESELGGGEKCFNCDFCGDITSELGEVKDGIIECLGINAGIKNIRINESCSGHRFIKDYRDLRKGD